MAPTFLFDSAQRQICEVRLPRTNTPLHALTLLNDIVFLDAARGLAERDREATAMFRAVLLREPSVAECQALARAREGAHAHYAAHPADAAALLDTSDPGRLFPLPGDVAGRAEMAAATIVANLLLNLDEAITHE